MAQDSVIPPMVRILPMDSVDEFYGWDVATAQQAYFLKYLPDDRNGQYLYKSQGLKADKGTIVLFQYDGQIIALARLINVEPFSQPVDTQYHGAIYFEPDSIMAFSPVSSDEMHEIWGHEFVDAEGENRSGFIGFSQTKTFLDPNRYPEFLQLLKTKRPTTFTKSTAVTGGKYGLIGEGIDHKRLKIWLSQNPADLKLEDVVQVNLEHRFQTGDAADIVFIHENGSFTIVEVETTHPLPGAHQAIKYRALLCAQQLLPLDTQKVHVILAAWTKPQDVEKFCKKYHIDPQRHKLPDDWDDNFVLS